MEKNPNSSEHGVDLGGGEVQEWETKFMREEEKPGFGVEGIQGVKAFYLEQLRVGYTRAPGSTCSERPRSKEQELGQQPSRLIFLCLKSLVFFWRENFHFAADLESCYYYKFR